MKRLGFLLALFGLGAGPATKKGGCPVCHGESEELGALAVGMDGRNGHGDRYWPNVGWVPSLRLHVCQKCGVVFTVKQPE